MVQMLTFTVLSKKLVLLKLTIIDYLLMTLIPLQIKPLQIKIQLQITQLLPQHQKQQLLIKKLQVWKIGLVLLGQLVTISLDLLQVLMLQLSLLLTRQQKNLLINGLVKLLLLIQLLLMLNICQHMLVEKSQLTIPIPTELVLYSVPFSLFHSLLYPLSSIDSIDYDDC